MLELIVKNAVKKGKEIFFFFKKKKIGRGHNLAGKRSPLILVENVINMMLCRKFVG